MAKPPGAGATATEVKAGFFFLSVTSHTPRGRRTLRDGPLRFLEWGAASSGRGLRDGCYAASSPFETLRSSEPVNLWLDYGCGLSAVVIRWAGGGWPRRE